MRPFIGHYGGPGGAKGGCREMVILVLFTLIFLGGLGFLVYWYGIRGYL